MRAEPEVKVVDKKGKGRFIANLQSLHRKKRTDKEGTRVKEFGGRYASEVSWGRFGGETRDIRDVPI